MKHLLSFGGGINSTALIIYLFERERSTFDEMAIVFADTGSEMPETYAHVEKFEGWLRDRGQKTIKVGRSDSLEAYCLETKSTPMSRWRWCTDKWKIRPILAWADEHLGRPWTQILGIASDEAHRAKENPNKGILNRFPLVEYGINRQGCEALIANAGINWPVPKSGCFFCPLMPSAQFVELKKGHPELFERAVALEKASVEANSGWEDVLGERPHVHPGSDACEEDECGCPPAPVVGKQWVVRGLLKHKPLEDIVGLKDKQMGLFGLENECDSGHCFV